MATQGEDLLFAQGYWKPSPAPSQPAALAARTGGAGCWDPRGAAPGLRTKTVAAAAEAGVCPVGWKGRVWLTRPQSTVAQPCSVTIFCSETAAFCKSTLRSLRKLRVHPAAKTVLRKPSQGLRPRGSERGHQTTWVSVRYSVLLCGAPPAGWPAKWASGY